MEDEFLVAASSIYLGCAGLIYVSMQKEKTRRKREWVKPWRLRRPTRGSFNFLHQELRLEDKNSRSYIRMNEECYQEILELIKVDARKSDTVLRDAISPEEKLSATLRFLATGESYRSLDFQTRLSLSFLSQTIPEMCSLIYEKLRDNYLKFPSSHNEWRNIAASFDQRWQFPLCIGALDGKHIAFRASKKDGGLYYNYKGFNSIVLLAMCDADYKFTYISVGCNGRISDGGVLNRSDLRKIISHSADYLPRDEIIGNHRILSYVIIEDDAFPLEEHIMRPFPYKSAEKSKQIFNYRLSHARQTIEHSFGILSNRFRVLQTTIHLQPQKVKEIVKACCALHNFLIVKSNSYMDPINFNQYCATENNEQSRSENQKNFSRLAGDIRIQFTEYFCNEGKTPWQDSYV